MAYTVKQVAALSGVSVRTLHFYDETGLLKPAYVGTNGYRFYEEPQLLTLQQILFYRELGLELKLIKQVLGRAEFERVAALQSHRQVLEVKLTRTRSLLGTIDKTIAHLKGRKKMTILQIVKELRGRQCRPTIVSASASWRRGLSAPVSTGWRSASSPRPVPSRITRHARRGDRRASAGPDPRHLGQVEIGQRRRLHAAFAADLHVGKWIILHRKFELPKTSSMSHYALGRVASNGPQSNRTLPRRIHCLPG